MQKRAQLLLSWPRNVTQIEFSLSSEGILLFIAFIALFLSNV